MEATINGARIHYDRAGEGLPVIFLHAGVADARMWRSQIEVFASQFDCIAPDMRGFGGSELRAEEWSAVDDLLGLIDQLRLKPAHLVGCSMGGALAIDFALQHGERISKLVLVAPGIGGVAPDAADAPLWEEVESAERSGDVEAMLRAEARLWLDGPTRPEGYVKDPLRAFMVEMNGSNVGQEWDKAPAKKLEPPAAERLQEITAPTLLIVGDHDVATVYKAAGVLMDKVPHARKVVIHDAAHLPNLEHPDEFNRIVLDFLLEN